jgi:diguanylate cyclase (GGDEF)-like protein
MNIARLLAPYSLARHIVWVTLATLAAILLLAGFTLATLFASERVEQSRGAALTQANVASSTVAAALRFGGKDVLTESLRVFDSSAHPDSAAVYDKQGKLVAEFVANGELRFPPLLSGVHGRASGALTATPVQVELSDDQVNSAVAALGTLVVNPNQSWLNAGYSRALGALAIVLAISAVFGVVVARVLSRAIFKPVTELTGWAEEVSKSRNLLIAAPRGGGLEVDQLTNSFEALIAQLTEQNRELKRKQYELKAQNEKLQNVAFLDVMTGLPNRASFDTTLTREMAVAGAAGRRLTMLTVDMDCLTAINDEHGRAQGDAAVQATAARIRRALRGSDFLARLAGAEFVVISNSIATPADAVKLGERLTVWLGISLPDDAWAEPIRASVGVTVFPDHGTDALSLMRSADQAMHRAKALPLDDSIRVVLAGEAPAPTNARATASSNVFTLPKQNRKSQAKI